MKRRRSRTRRVLKWCLIVSCAVLGLLWFASRWLAPWCELYYAGGERGLFASATNGEIWLWYAVRDAEAVRELARQGHPLRSECGLSRPYLDSFFWPEFAPVRYERHPNVVYAKDQPGRVCGYQVELAVAIWLVLVPFLVATIALWWLDYRKFPIGHCQCCGYDLTGNVSGRCPECGAAVRQEGASA